MKFSEIVFLEGGGLGSSKGAERIKKEDIDLTFKNFCKNFKKLTLIDISNSKFLGSVGKKETSGDIDCALSKDVSNKQFIEKLRNEFWSFYITLIKPLYRKKRFIELIKLVDLNKNDLSLTKYSKQLMLNLHKILYNTEVSKEQKEFINSIKHKLTKSIFEYWKTTRSKYKKKFESAILHYLNNIHEKRRDLKTHDEFLINNFEIEKVLVTTHSLNKLTEDEKAIFMNTFKNIKLEIFEDLQQFKSTIKEILR